jgi:hypothetical protein
MAITIATTQVHMPRTGGILDNITRDRSQPLANALKKPPRNVDTSWRNLPTSISVSNEKCVKP